MTILNPVLQKIEENGFEMEEVEHKDIFADNKDYLELLNAKEE